MNGFFSWIKNHALFLIVVVAYLVHAVYYANTFLLPVVDADQLIMADLASFYAQGTIPEPYFWGQNYLFPLESWLAVPLVIVGIRPDLAVTTIALCAFYLPYVFASFMTFKKRTWILFLLVSVLPFVLPPAYLIATMMPRNFGTTASLVAGGIILALVANSKWQFVASGLIIGVSVASNPATAILLPALFMVRSRQFWLLGAPAFFLSALIIQGLGLYYVLNPDAIRYTPEPIALSVSQLIESFSTPGIYLTPLLLIAVSAPIFFSSIVSAQSTTRIRIGVVLMLSALMIIVLLATDRISSFTSSPFYSSYRFWSALPLLGVVIAVAAAFDTKKSSPAFGRNKTIVTIGVLLLLFAGQATLASARSGAYLTLPTPTGISPRQDVVDECNDIAQKIDRRTQYVQLETDNPWLMYGCHSMDNVIVTFPEKDRRTWLNNYTSERSLEQTSLNP